MHKAIGHNSPCEYQKSNTTSINECSLQRICMYHCCYCFYYCACVRKSVSKHVPTCKYGSQKTTFKHALFPPCWQGVSCFCHADFHTAKPSRQLKGNNVYEAFLDEQYRKAPNRAGHSVPKPQRDLPVGQC